MVKTSVSFIFFSYVYTDTVDTAFAKCCYIESMPLQYFFRRGSF